MKTIIVILRASICIGLFACTRLNTPMQVDAIYRDSVKVMWNIDFQAGFLSDTVSLIVNNTHVLDNILVSSESSSSFSGVKVTCYKGENNLVPKFLHIFTSNVNKVVDFSTHESDSLDLIVSIKTISGLESSQKVSIGKQAGKYIGISKSQGHAVVLYIRQNKRPFLYY